MTGLLYIHICRKGILIYIGKDMSLIYTDLLYRDLTKMTYLWEM
jgi:hypothetical protein